jgi:hypothetical protein
VKVIGANLVVIPSQPMPWAGTPVEGSRWTQQQLDALELNSRDPETVPTAAVELHPAGGAQFGKAFDFRKVIVPVLIRGRAGQAKIIRPDGSIILRSVKHG